MASAPQSSDLPLFYQGLAPLSSELHGNYRARAMDKAPFLTNVHMVPVTSDEFIPASRVYPIVFSDTPTPVPLALMGLNEGVNVFVDGDGALINQVYVPAYIRRYPFMLARLSPEATDLTLCFDPTSEAVGAFEDGDPLFDGDKPSAATQNVLSFCQQFEEAGLRTQNFVEELVKLDLLMDGEFSIQQDGVDKPFVYRGFKMVDEEKLREMRGDALRKIAQNGILALIYAHLFSMHLIRDLFAMQVQQGKMPAGIPQPVPAS